MLILGYKFKILQEWLEQLWKYQRRINDVIKEVVTWAIQEAVADE